MFVRALDFFSLKNHLEKHTTQQLYYKRVLLFSFLQKLGLCEKTPSEVSFRNGLKNSSNGRAELVQLSMEDMIRHGFLWNNSLRNIRHSIIFLKNVE